MGISRARPRNISALLGGALLATVPATAATAATAPAPTVAISSVSNGQTLSGQVTISVTIQVPAGVTISSAVLAIRDGSNEEYGTVAPQPGQCDSSCTLAWTADTAALRPYGATSTSYPVLPDAGGSILATVNSTAGPTYATPVSVTIDNHRPTLAPAPGSRSYLRETEALGDQSATFTVNAAASPTAAAGTTVSSVEFELPGAKPAFPAIQFTQDGSSSTWTATGDTSALTPGIYTGTIVATDSNGTVSSLLPAVIVVDHGFTLTAPTVGVVGPDWTSGQFDYAYPEPFTCGNAYTGAHLANVDVLADGKQWGSGNLTYTDPQSTPNGCAVPLNLVPLPFGHHVLTYVVTDEAGVQEQVSQDVTVALPLATSWPTAPITVTEGSTLHLAPTVTAPDRFSNLQSWQIAYNGTTLASGSYPNQPSLTWTTPAKQLVNGKLTLTTVSDSGLTSTDTVTVTGAWPTATFLNASATSVARGAWVKLTATPWQRVAGTWSNAAKVTAKTTIQWQRGSDWYNGTSLSTSPAGVWVHAATSECYRAVWAPAAGGTDLGSTSAPICITVKP